MSNLSASPETISPKQAEAWIEHNYQYNRPISQAHVAFLASEMEKGQFTSAVIHFVYEGNNVHLINGQHTLRASVKSGRSFNAIVIREKVEDGNTGLLAKKYMHHDIHRKRSFMDSARAFGLGEKMGLPDTWLNLMASAIKFGRTGFGVKADVRGAQTYTSISDLFDLVVVWERESKILHELLGGTYRGKGLRRRSFLSIALVTMYYQQEKAIEFWGKAATDDGLSIGDPRKTLHEYARDTIAPRGFKGSVVPNDVMSIAACHCWNAFVEDRPYSRVNVRHDMRGKPMYLVGTSYTGNQSVDFWPARNRELYKAKEIWNQSAVAA